MGAVLDELPLEKVAVDETSRDMEVLKREKRAAFHRRRH